ncbi:hypothetical protein HZI73_25370 [Vallitalea pronyensis]|uniref:DUF5780 domain-containing protein n=1 Tax=Vallitalea pronyensis TaxID=1348613 RepID=A0A8J8SIZ0_9FIRM|nr:DUF5780 domain-containing protein [Vallitalea pronyensis]QUI25420.1 hypothetical protein HZI73_25370 [Vallitalea pronyensis]
MKKRFSLVIISLFICFILVACGSEKKQEVMNSSVKETNSRPEETKVEDNETSKKQDSVDKQVSDEPKDSAKTMTLQEFGELLKALPVSIISTEYVVQSEEYKSLYPDMLQAVIKNNTEKDIRNAVIAFVAWDENDLPLKIKGDMDFNNPDYLREVNYSDINLVGGATFGEESGFSIDSAIGVDTFEAIVISYETFEGEKWKNPYYDEFKTVYEGQKLSDDMTVEVVIESNTSLVTSRKNNSDKKPSMAQNELEELLKALPITIISTEYVVQSEEYKSLYPDMLQAVIKNNTEKDIRDAVIAFVAWDENGLPLKIKGDMDFNDPDYLREINYSDINLVGGATFGEESGFSIDSAIGVDTFEAIVVSYETFEDEKWENPYYDEFKELYVNVKRNQ